MEEEVEGGIFTFSRLRETTPEKKKKHIHTHTHRYHTWQSGFSVSPSVCEMSTKAEQCKYGCLVCGFPPVMSWRGGGGGGGGSSGGSGSGGSGGWVGRALEMRFFVLFLAKKSIWGELSLVMKPRLPWQVATRPLTAEDGWRAQSTQEAPVFHCVCVSLGMLSGRGGGGCGGHSNGEMTQSSCDLFNLFQFTVFLFVDWRGRVRRVRTSEVLLLDSRSTWLNVSWTIWWHQIDH